MAGTGETATKTPMRGGTADEGARGPDPSGAQPARGRRIAFRALAIVLSLWVVLLGIFGLTEVVLMWLPAETVGSIMEDPGGPDIEMHRSHFMAIGILAWATVLPLLAQLRRPERRVGSMRFLVVLAVASLVVFGLSGTFGEWVLEEWTWVIPVLVLALLHPRARDLVRVPGHDRVQLALAGVAAIPPSAFYANPAHGRDLVRFAFCKKRETMEEAVRRMEQALAGHV